MHRAKPLKTVEQEKSETPCSTKNQTLKSDPCNMKRFEVNINTN